LLPDDPGYITQAREDTPLETEQCPRCGRHVWFVIEVVGAEEGVEFSEVVRTRRGRGNTYWLNALE
jgi:hypothetical protein